MSVALTLGLVQPALSQHGSPAQAEAAAAVAAPEKYAFEWGGVYALPEGITDLVAGDLVACAGVHPRRRRSRCRGSRS